MSFIGPAMPPHLTSQVESEEEEVKEDSVIGPAMPPMLRPHTEDKCIIGPAMPPHLKPQCDSSDGEDDVGIGPVMPSHLKPQAEEEEEKDEGPDLYGPALPPGFGPSSSKPRIIGPTLPPGVSIGQVGDEDSSDDEVVGPMPVPADVDLAAYMQQQVESRALRMMTKLTDKGKEGKVERESWMIDLPTNRTGLIGLEARSFRKNAGPGKNADTSAWTDTPEEKQRKAKGLQPQTTASSAEELEEIAMRERDKHMAKRAAKHASKRSAESLVDTHQKEINKKKKAEAEKKQERKMFDREKDLQVNRFDEAQKRAVLNKAKFLDDRFSAGNQKFL